MGIESLTLLRSMKYEVLLPPDERGVTASFERHQDDVDRNLLQVVRYVRMEKTVHIETQSWACDLDVRKVDPQELTQMHDVFHSMNRDARFRYTVV
jgi:hypothetical protein